MPWHPLDQASKLLLSCVCLFTPSILDASLQRSVYVYSRTSHSQSGHSHLSGERLAEELFFSLHLPFEMLACFFWLNLYREKGSTAPFPRRLSFEPNFVYCAEYEDCRCCIEQDGQRWNRLADNFRTLSEKQ